MKLKLPDVTLVMVETREHDLARMAVEDCLRVAEFGEVLIVTDRPLEFSPLTHHCEPRFHIVPDWPDKLGWSRSWWFDVPPLLRTRQTLNIQWDSWIWDTSMWRDEFMDYDYVGAPWWYKDGKNVGNGGFSIISTRLKRYICNRRDQFPCDTAVDDDLLCRKYRPKLETAGFLWAPEKVAHDFAFECCRPSPTSKHFGFHGMFNWNEVLDHDRLIERMGIALRSPYISNPDSQFMKAFCQKNPEIVKELLKDQPTLKGAIHG
jgi:hypothetical protein